MGDATQQEVQSREGGAIWDATCIWRQGYGQGRHSAAYWRTSWKGLLGTSFTGAAGPPSLPWSARDHRCRRMEVKLCMYPEIPICLTGGCRPPVQSIYEL